MNIAVSALILAVLVLSVLLIITVRKKPDGVILINKDDPMKDTYTLEMHISFGELDERKKVIFEVRSVQ